MRWGVMSLWHPQKLFAPIARGVITTGSDGTATINFPYPLSKKPTVLLSPDADQVVAVILSWITDASGKYTGCKIKTYKIVPSLLKNITRVVRSVSKSTGSAVTGISVSKKDLVTDTVLKDVTPGKAYALIGIQKFTDTVLADIGNDTGWSVDANNYIRHTHTKSTKTVLTDISVTDDQFVQTISKTTTQVVTGLSTEAGNQVVTDVSPTTGTVVTDVTTTSKTVLSNVSAAAQVVANIPVFYVVVPN